MLWIAGIINAINLIDGLDGLAGGVAFVALAVTFGFAAVRGDPLLMLFSAALAGAVLGFLRYNFNPASIFMGDTGSMFLGFVLAVSSIHAHQRSPTKVMLFVPIVVLAFPITDTLLAMSRRAVRGSPLFQADRGHIHHRLLDRGLSQRATVLVLYGTCVLLGASAFALAFATRGERAAILAALAAGVALGLRGRGYLPVEDAPSVLELRRRNLTRRSSMKDVAAQLRRAAEVGAVWDTVKSAGQALGASSVSLRLVTENSRGHRRAHHFAQDRGAPLANTLATQHSLLVERPDAGVLELRWPERTPCRDTELAIEELCRNVQAALTRIGPIGPEAVGTADAHVLGGVAPWHVEPERSAKVVKLG
jgi:UDP-GlcNAc:undecaprenyl-phosphate GlcNAc-1-phosphate transferase